MTDKYEALSEKIDRISGRLEAKLDMILVLLQHTDNGNTTTPVNVSDVSRTPLGRLTTKQHAALQMLMAGCSNNDIASQFGVTVNTAKVYVRGLAARFSVTTRTQIVLSATGPMSSVSDDEYLVLSGGLPKNWFTQLKTPDPYAGLYRADA